jgi:hypothetical protein
MRGVIPRPNGSLPNVVSLALLTLVALVPQVASAQNIVTVGQELLVNTFGAGRQATTSGAAGRSVAMDAAGNFVVVWTSDQQDGSSDGVFAQRYSASGVKQGSEFQVNTITENSQQDPGVAMDAGGNFVVVWDGVSPDTDTFDIYAKRYNAAGVALGSEFRVNTVRQAFQFYPTIAMNQAGGFVIAWAGGSGPFEVSAQRFNANGVRQGGQFQVNTFTDNDQFFPAIAIDQAGNFVIVWASDRQETGTDPSSGIYGQRFDVSGVKQGGEFHVNTFTERNQEEPSIAMDATSGNFVVAWESFAQDGDNFGVYAQRFDAAGVPQGPEFRVNTATQNGQGSPSVVSYANGQFMVVFSSVGPVSPDGDVFARRYSSGGDQGPEFLVNTETFRPQGLPHVATNGSKTVIVWTSFGQEGRGNNSAGIVGQRYTTANPAGRGEVLISEFRLSGPQGLSDGFVELYNNTDGPIDISSYDLVLVDRTGSNLFPLTLPERTGIPPRGHYLIAGNIAGSNFGKDIEIPDPPDASWLGGVALLNRGSAIDSVLFSDTVLAGGSFVPLFRQGNPLPQVGAAASDYAWVRDLATGFPRNTGDNLSDFLLVSTTGGSVGGVLSRLGAPGPETTSSPIQVNATFPASMIDATAAPGAAPNRVRDVSDTDPAANKTLGTLSIRRRFTNLTGEAITRLSFRIVQTTSGPAPAGVADLRALSSSDVNVMVNDVNQCMPNPAPCQLTVRGTTLEVLPIQQGGGGLNSTLAVTEVNLAQPLPNGASVNLQFLLGVQQSGTFRFYVNVEALP